MELTNAPVPAPSVVLLSAVVGLEEVLQQTPRAVTAAPPSEITFPPLVAVYAATALAAVVVIFATAADTAPPHQFVQVVPLKTCNSPDEPQLLHQIICPA